MATKVGFLNPTTHEGWFVSGGQKIREYIGAYFYLGGRDAVGVPENGSIGVNVQEKQSSWRETARKVASYFTVALPVLMFVGKVISRAFYPFHECQRTLPDGTQESGTFVNGVLYQGVRIQDDRTTFLRPKLLFGGEEITLNFAEVIIDGRIEIIPVQEIDQPGVFNRDQQYTRYPGSPNEALWKMAQTPSVYLMRLDKYGSPIKFVLEHANNRLLRTEEFLTYLLTPSQDRGLPINKIDKRSLLEVLELAISNNVAINLETVDPITHESVFSKRVGQGDVKLTQALLAIDPSAIHQTEGREESFFARAVLGGFAEEAQVLLQAMQAQGIELTQVDRWLQKAFTNDCNFTNEEFLQLPTEVQQKMFKIANIYIHNEFLQKLRGFGMRQLPAQPARADLFSYNMDAIDVRETLQAFLGNLRRDGLLLTEEEFAQKDPARYYHKYNDIGRILGRNYIERTASRLNLPHIKVPKKIAVIQPKDKQTLTLEFIIPKNGAMHVECRSLQIYAERIESIKRKATRAEMMGLLNLIEATGFDDFFGRNLFIGKNHNGEEGIYFIDTEYGNFSCLPSFNNIANLNALMAQEDHSWLQEELNRRLDLVRPQREARKLALQEELDQQKPAFIRHGFADRRKPFVFNIADLLTQEVREEAANE